MFQPEPEVAILDFPEKTNLQLNGEILISYALGNKVYTLQAKRYGYEDNLLKKSINSVNSNIDKMVRMDNSLAYFFLPVIKITR